MPSDATWLRRVAWMYLPVLALVIELLPMVRLSYSTDEKRRLCFFLLRILKPLSTAPTATSGSSFVSPRPLARPVLGQSRDSTSSPLLPRAIESAPESSSRQQLAAGDQIDYWWRADTRKGHVQFFELLLLISETFEYKPPPIITSSASASHEVPSAATAVTTEKHLDAKEKLESYFATRQAAQPAPAASRAQLRQNLMQLRQQKRGAAADTSAGDVTREHSRAYSRAPHPLPDDSVTIGSPEMALSAETSYVVLDVCELFLCTFLDDFKSLSAPTTSNGSEPLLDELITLLAGMLARNQPVTFLSCLYASLRALAIKLARQLFFSQVSV